MKETKYLGWPFRLMLLAVILLLAFLFWPRAKLGSNHDRETEATTSLNSEAQKNVKDDSLAASNELNQARSTPWDNAATNPPKRAELFSEMTEEKNIPVNFYGRVIDQEGRGLSGVQVSVKVRHWYVQSAAALNIDGQMLSLETKTDSDGHFHLEGVKGDAMDFQFVKKEGYELEPNTQVSHGPKGGDLNNPVIFRMWKDGINEKLITGKKSFKVVPDGSVYFIDLTSGTITEPGQGAGDIKVWIKRPAQIAFGEKYEWSCAIESVVVGLLQEKNSNSSMYLAPQDGYTQLFQFDQKVQSGWGNSTGTQRFYLKLNEGRNYARISIELLASFNNETPALVRINYAVNPSGSRVLR